MKFNINDHILSTYNTNISGKIIGIRDNRGLREYVVSWNHLYNAEYYSEHALLVLHNPIKLCKNH